MMEVLAPTHVVLIPAYEPGRALNDSVDQLIAVHFTVVVVDDGSGKEYQHVFDELDKSVHVIRQDINKGKGAALKKGLQYIRRTFSQFVVITADADGQHHVGDIKKMAQVYGRHPRRLLLGARTFENKNVPLRSKFGNVVTRKIFSLISKQSLHDTQTGLRAFDQDLIDFMMNVPGERFEYEMNVLLAVSREGIVIVELPIKTIYENNNENSHFQTVRDSWSIYREIIKFASSSIISFIIDYATFIVLLNMTDSWALASSVTFANIAARVISASFNFTMNKHFIFKHKGSLARGSFSYFLLASGILIGNTILLSILTGTFALNPYVSKIVTEVSLFFISYVIQKNIVFSEQTVA